MKLTNIDGNWYEIVDQADAKVVEEPAPVDMGPLTLDEWNRLEIGDTIHFWSPKRGIMRVNAIELGKCGNRRIRVQYLWSFDDGPWFPTEETARRLRGGK